MGFTANQWGDPRPHIDPGLAAWVAVPLGWCALETDRRRRAGAP